MYAQSKFPSPDRCESVLNQVSDARELVAELEFVWDQIKSNVPSTSSESGPIMTPDVSTTQQAETQRADDEIDAPIQVVSPMSQDEKGSGKNQISQLDRKVGANQGRSRESLGYRNSSTDEMRWRRRVENTLVKITAEIAALREQIEERRSWRRPPTLGLWRWLTLTAGTVMKHMMIDLIIFAILVGLMRRRGDPRVEDAAHAIFGLAKERLSRIRTRRK